MGTHGGPGGKPRARLPGKVPLIHDTIPTATPRPNKIKENILECKISWEAGLASDDL